jgi:Myb/SANT-like DNA-binding domain
MGSPKKAAAKAKWDLKKDSTLVELLLTHTRAGEKSDSGFKAQIWKAIAIAFNKKWPALKPKQLQCRAQSVFFTMTEGV